MTTTFHVEIVIPAAGRPGRVFFADEGDEIRATVDMMDGSSLIDAGLWSSIDEAFKSGKKFVEEAELDSEVLPWKNQGYLLIVAQETQTKEWSIIAGKGKNPMVDTGIRRKTEAEIRKLLE